MVMIIGRIAYLVADLMERDSSHFARVCNSSGVPLNLRMCFLLLSVAVFISHCSNHAVLNLSPSPERSFGFAPPSGRSPLIPCDVTEWQFEHFCSRKIVLPSLIVPSLIALPPCALALMQVTKRIAAANEMSCLVVIANSLFAERRCHYSAALQLRRICSEMVDSKGFRGKRKLETVRKSSCCRSRSHK